MMLTPAMQGIILAIAKARQTFDKDGAEAGLIKVHTLLMDLIAALQCKISQRDSFFSDVVLQEQ